MFRLYALWLYFAEKDWTGPAPPYGNRIKHRRDRTSGWIWSAGKFCKTIPACYWIITTRIPKAYKIGLVQMGKQCKHIHVLRFWPDCTDQKCLLRDTPQALKIVSFVTAARPADAKIWNKQKKTLCKWFIHSHRAFSRSLSIGQYFYNTSLCSSANLPRRLNLCILRFQSRLSRSWTAVNYFNPHILLWMLLTDVTLAVNSAQAPSRHTGVST